ncbi:Acyl-CoA synthetase (AMP-forming)/AMP-acid ligase II, partial [Nitrosovibrio sp. Nv17]
MVEHLRRLAAQRPGDTAVIEVGAGDDTLLSYAELDGRARVLAAQLQARLEPGERVLILLDNDLHYVAAFFACLYAGMIAVPAFPPESARAQHLARLVAIAADSGARCILATEAVRGMLEAATISIAPEALFLAVDASGSDPAPQWREHAPAESDIAFLQYTSGSTGAPKGVMVSHGNLMANERAIEEGLSVRADDVFVSWLPLYHDMGLIGGLLQPVHRGIPVALMTPRHFLERPLRWLEAISRHRGTISGGPDFAYRLCAERVREDRLQALDLSSWRIAFSGSEPVRHETLESFVAGFAPAGFAAEAVYPCYGLAEATLFVTGGRRGAGMVAHAFSREALVQGRALPEQAGAMLVGCGAAPAGHRLDIVDPERLAPLPDGGVGEIWASGPSISLGYWQRAQETRERFAERGGRRWLRTGDLGFRHDGQLYITGRLKDLIIVRGQNIYPQDIEHAIETGVEMVRKGRIAAFSVETGAGEGIGVAVEVSRGMQKRVPAEALVAALAEAVGMACHEPLSVAVLLNPGALPRTSSGKLQRSACRQGWLDRTLDAYAVHEAGRFTMGGGASAAQPRREEGLRPGGIESELARIWQDVLGCGALGREANFFASGGSSLAAARIGMRIAEKWGIEFPVRVLFEHPTLQGCAHQVGRLLTGGPHQLPIVRLREGSAGAGELSYAQGRLWFLWRLEPEGTAYHICGGLELSGELDVEALRWSFERIVERHGSLRSVFRAGAEGQGEQIVRGHQALAIDLVDLSGP